MVIEIKAPSPGESISEVEIASWLVGDGDYVQKDQELAEIESDKATLPLVAGKAGKIRIIEQAGSVVRVGTLLCSIDTDAAPPKDAAGPKEDTGTGEISAPLQTEEAGPAATPERTPDMPLRVTPVARKLMAENGLTAEDVLSGLKRIGSREVRAVLAAGQVNSGGDGMVSAPGDRSEERIRISQLRKKLSERLVAVKNQTAMLTTFNEADMSGIIRLRKTWQKDFQEKHGIKLGFMSFFTRAVTEALRVFPNVNSRIEDGAVVRPAYVDVGIAVQTDKGLMVPVLRNTETMSLAGIEKRIAELAARARINRLSLEEMSGGTFTITNGGVFGSMLSTPILNPPQSAILGMHNIMDRPVARDGQVVIRPMMYLALSYDHRIIDGKESVSFLVKLKELLENPVSMLFEGSDPERLLLDI